ncbi:outer membrane lipoprotein-sorting protein [Paenibacillus radicis (ex Xue et al. 2023)]|uniref:Outer membrane lipoprotein carrier protein LolA n=1 Tax=Paenibacillus radicis (ex Xue et al. 2023) TaxID=2972489 RepID=A0ABT1YUB5_9BACL|nr:outer membrane lipoprotein-sorting protein [Paenibacillus radicis (ex Xue et al. 2023)]MCR8635999.1 outer membrane lipoprotein carrier protein LolA [Paenibacillus radicis (ex Xue et al. 2023)]
MRRVTWVIALVMCLSLVLAGCGKKDAGSVVKDLDTMLNKLDSYQGSGRMILHTGQEPQEYQVDVWYQNPHYYRISLKNDKKDITQIVLRNDDGVFVLTPHLNKSFRFQSDWPENQGQVYLYQSLVQSILLDNERQFTTDDKGYVFDVLANYQNGSLARQKIWLDKKTYAPQHVEVSDSNANVMVIVDFNQFEFSKKFEKDSFDMQRNMTSWKIETLPTMAAAPAGDAKAADAGKAGTTAASSGKAGAAGAAAGPAGATGAAAGQGASAGTAGSGAAAGTGAAAATGTAAGKDGAAGQGKAAGPAAATGAPAGQATGAGTAAAGQAAGTKAGAAAAPGAGANGGAPAAATTSNGAQSKAGAAATGTAAAVTPADAAKQKAAAQKQFGVIEPYYTPSGVKRQDVNEIKLGEEKAVMLRYSGKYNYTLVESHPQTQTVSVLPGDIVDLGYTLAVVTGDEKKTLMWTYDGVEFRLSTGDLPMTEMIKVAQAVQGEMGK